MEAGNDLRDPHKRSATGPITNTPQSPRRKPPSSHLPERRRRNDGRLVYRQAQRCQLNGIKKSESGAKCPQPTFHALSGPSGVKLSGTLGQGNIYIYIYTTLQTSPIVLGSLKMVAYHFNNNFLRLFRFKRTNHRK